MQVGVSASKVATTHDFCCIPWSKGEGIRNRFLQLASLQSGNINKHVGVGKQKQRLA